MQETWVQSLAWEDPLEKQTAIHSRILGNSYSLRDSGLENSMNCIVHGVAKSWTQLSYLFTFTFYLSTNIAHKCCAIWIHTSLVMKRKGIISVDPKQIRLLCISPGKRFIPGSAGVCNLGSAITWTTTQASAAPPKERILLRRKGRWEGCRKQNPWVFFGWVLARKEDWSSHQPLLDSQGVRVPPVSIPGLFNCGFFLHSPQSTVELKFKN